MQSIKEKVALSSIAASAGLTVAKALVGLASGSLAILSEAAHSLLDLAATVMTFFAVRLSSKPADAEHHYGHGKIESMAALAETALLFLLSGVVIWEALQRLSGTHGPKVEASAWAFAVIIASIIIDFFRARVLYRTAQDTSSEALEADALHFSSDMWSSAAVLLGLTAVALGHGWADPLAAMIVAIFICVAGWRLARRTFETLTDTAPAGVPMTIAAAVERVAGVVGLERLRARQVGGTLFVDLVVGVSRTLPLDRVAAVKTRIIEAVRATHPAAEVTVGTEPRALDNETVLDRVMVIARNHALAVHHVTVHALENRLAVSLDLEVDGALTLGAAHEVASKLEQAIRDELGPTVEVDTHIEPLQPHDEPGREATPARVADVRQALSEIATHVDQVGEIHDVRVREAEGGEVVNFHCHIDAEVKVSEMHEKVDDLERALRRRFPQIKRVIGHAEPVSRRGIAGAA
jgi:cation diffusion facilitator family transporter